MEPPSSSSPTTNDYEQEPEVEGATPYLSYPKGPPGPGPGPADDLFRPPPLVVEGVGVDGGGGWTRVESTYNTLHQILSPKDWRAGEEAKNNGAIFSDPEPSSTSSEKTQSIKELHNLSIKGVLVDPFPGDDEGEDSPVSKVLSMLVTEDERDLELSEYCIKDLVKVFFEEFDSVPIQSFAIETIIGYIESRRLNTRTKLVAAFSIIIEANYKSAELQRLQFTALTSNMYTTLKYGCPAPVRCAEGVLYDSLDIYSLAQLFVSEETQDVCTNLKCVISRWEAEQMNLSTTHAYVRENVNRNIFRMVKMLESKLFQVFGISPSVIQTNLDINEVLLENIDKLALERRAIRQKIASVRQDIVVNEYMKELIQDWAKYDTYLENPSQCYIDELLLTTPFPETDCSPKDMLWIHPTISKEDPNNDADEGLSLETGDLTEFQILMQQAFKETINIQQRQQLVDEIRENPTLEFPGLYPHTLHDLVEYNPVIAIEVLVKLYSNRVVMKEYLQAIVNMDMSVHSMEVVNRLTSSVVLPKDFLHVYVSNCIKTCEAIQDKYVQNRLVRLLCVFLQALIRNQCIDTEDIYVEVMVFLIAFSRIREAAALFRLIRHVESEDPEVRELITKRLEDNQQLSPESKQPGNLNAKPQQL